MGRRKGPGPPSESTSPKPPPETRLPEFDPNPPPSGFVARTFNVHAHDHTPHISS